MKRSTRLLLQLTIAFSLVLAPATALGVTEAPTTTSTTNHTTVQETLAGSNTSETSTEAEEHEADPGLLGTLGINWKLLIAQLVNFGIVLFVLWKWVFGPVAKGLEKRTKKIEQSLTDAENIAKDKEEFTVWKNKELGNARAEAAQIVTDAKKEAEGVKASIAEQTKLEQEKIVAQAKAKMVSEQEKAITEIKGEIAELVISATQKILQSKLDPAKDKELIKDALKNI